MKTLLSYTSLLFIFGKIYDTRFITFMITKTTA